MKLSVVIPAYNAAKYIGQAIASVRKGNWNGELEVIVVDDGSTDNTVELASDLADLVIRSEHRNAANARNKGAAAAGGDYIFFLDADDVLEDGILGMLQQDAVNSEAVFAMSEDFISPEISGTEKASLSARTEAYSGVLPGCALIKKSLFDRVGPFDETLGSAETVAWMMRLREICPDYRQVQRVSLHRRIHLTNTGRVSKKQEYSNYAALLRQRMAARKKQEQGNE